MMKKLHWTQAAEGKKKLSRIRKKVWKAQRRKTDEEFSDESEAPKTPVKRPKVVAVVNNEDVSIKDLLESLFERAEEVQEAARQIADKLGLEL